MNVLELEADRALFEGKIEGLAVTCYANQRPLSGLVGLLDWRFNGAISEYVRSGAVTGKTGEICYLPLSRRNRVFHVLLLGCGNLDKQKKIPEEILTVLQKNLSSLQIQNIGISKSDFGNVSDDYFLKHLKGSPVWVLP